METAKDLGELLLTWALLGVFLGLAWTILMKHRDDRAARRQKMEMAELEKQEMVSRLKDARERRRSREQNFEEKSDG